MRTVSSSSTMRRNATSLMPMYTRMPISAGSNIAGSPMVFPGIVGAQSFKIFDLEAAATGLNEREATEAGFHPVQAAWKKYKPVASPAPQTAATLPAEAGWTKAYTEEVKTFINQQIAARVQKLQADIMVLTDAGN